MIIKGLDFKLFARNNNSNMFFIPTLFAGYHIDNKEFSITFNWFRFVTGLSVIKEGTLFEGSVLSQMSKGWEDTLKSYSHKDIQDAIDNYSPNGEIVEEIIKDKLSK